MNSENHARNKNTEDEELGANYNFQHLILTTKYRNPAFDDAKTIGVARRAFYDAAERHGIGIKVLSFGDDFAHVHMEISIPYTMTVSDAAQLLKGYSSYILFKEIPSLRKEWFWGGEFWGRHYGSRSVGVQGQEIVENYITKQDISDRFMGQTKLN
jgi:REP element-mobilizing transposase RayT